MTTKQAVNPEIDDIKHDAFTVFTKYDMNPNGTIASTYPMWFFDRVREELENDIVVMENQIKRSYVPEERVPEYRENIKRLKHKLQEMDDAIPKFNSKIMNFINDVIPTLTEKLVNSLPTRTEMEKGLIYPEEEARRMTTPCILLNEKEIRWAKACNVSPHKGMVSRTQLEVMWKIGRKILGEDTNIERIRRG